MKSINRFPLKLLLTLPSSLLILTIPTNVKAQITPAVDGTGTIVIPKSTELNITGGTTSGNGDNLFHRFIDFNVPDHQTANFLTNTSIKNILGSVTGGNPSVILGKIQVIGGNSNLFLTNPSGWIFGPNSSLNLPGSFLATTANQIGFLGDQFFNATGHNNYQQLNGNPISFNFNNNNGIIINQGDLKVNPNQNISLIGSTIINSGSIQAPSGQITLAAVPGTSLVRLSQPGMILGLEFTPPDHPSQPVKLTELPQLLTGTNLPANIYSGDVIIDGKLISQQITLLATNRVKPTDPKLVQTSNGTQSAPTVIIAPSSKQDLNTFVFLDTSVDDYQSLLYGTKPGTTTTVITNQDHGIDKITQTLKDQTQVDSIHIVADGDEGNFWLGKTFISADNIDQYQSKLNSWKAAFSSEASILIYACNTARGTGFSLLQSIKNYTTAEVAGSTNLTGSSLLGADWILERSTGPINNSANAFTDTTVNQYQHKLAIFTVSNPFDISTGTLREAINLANTTLGTDEIRFSIGFIGSDQIINLNSALPNIIEPVIIDATTQGGMGYTGRPLVEINGTNITIPTQSGLTLATGSNGSTIKGLSITGFGGNAINIDSNSNTITGNYLGIRPDGTAFNNNGIGININGNLNTIGGTLAENRNIIGANDIDGILISSSGSRNTIIGNYIGTQTDGLGNIANGIVGIKIEGFNNTIGGPGTQRNIIGNSPIGIMLNGIAANNNIIQNNYIGVDNTGSGNIGNTSGITIQNGINNIIGGSNTGEGNIISGNTTGIFINLSNGNNEIKGNIIGLDATGINIVPNQTGINIQNSTNVIIGGTNTTDRNIISGNNGSGIEIAGIGASNNTIEGNYIGTDINATTSKPNTNDGILLNTSTFSNTIKNNVISGNSNAGITLNGAANNNIIESNLIGLDGTGAIAIPNSFDGIRILNASNNTITKNTISGNTLGGVFIQSSNSSMNEVSINKIGTNQIGAIAIPNQQYGIRIENSPTNTIGPTNVISGNNGPGIVIEGDDANTNVIIGNFIGLNETGNSALSNTSEGIRINLASNTIIGRANTENRNIISGNLGAGISILDAVGTTIINNYIGTDSTGSTAIPNSTQGIFIEHSLNNIIGSTLTNERNLISGNTSAGILISGATSFNNQILGNYIGLDINGITAIPNQEGIRLENNSNSNLIDSNIISGNTTNGINLLNSINNTISQNTIGLDSSFNAILPNGADGIILQQSSNNIIGGTIAARNIISGNSGNGIQIVQSDNIEITGNYIGTSIGGNIPLGNTLNGVAVQGSNNIIGSETVGNVISGNRFAGVAIVSDSSLSNKVQGNYIGTDATGTSEVGNAYAGVLIALSRSNLIGGNSNARGNIISGNQHGVLVLGTGATNNQISGNAIGTQSDRLSSLANSTTGIQIGGLASTDLLIGKTLPLSGYSITFNNSNLTVKGVNTPYDVSRTTVGGLATGEGNIIANNPKGVVIIGNNSLNNPIYSNSIYNNSQIGIDLNNDGITINQTGTRTGPNQLQNYPVLYSITGNNIKGSFHSQPNTTYLIQFFASPTTDQGKTLIGSQSITTDSLGNANINTNITGTITPGYVVTATATDTVLGNTSEFSATPGITHTLISGNNQTSIVNNPFTQPLQTQVTDSRSNPAVGLPINYTVPGTGASGTFTSTSISTDNTGIASNGTLTANTIAGSYTIGSLINGFPPSGIQDGVNGLVNFSLTNNPDVPFQITATGGSGQTGTVNTNLTIPLSAIVTDQYGNATPNVTVNFTTPTTGASAIINGGTSLLTNATGQVTTGTLTTNTIAGNYTISATTGAIAPIAFNLTNTPDVPFQIIPLTGTPQTTTVNTNFGNPLVAQVTDQFNNPIPNITVNFTTPTTGASATINGSTTLTTDSTGTVTTSSLTANTIAGNYAINANSTTLLPANFNLTNNPDAPFQIIPLTGTPQTTTVNTNFGNPLVAQVTDKFNNPIPNITVNFTTPNTGASATINGSTTLTTDSTGTVTTSSLTANTIAGNYSINANTTTLTPALFNLTNNPDAPFQIIPLTGTPQTTTVNTNFGNPLVAQVTDQFNNPIPNVAVNFTTPNTGASATINGSTTLTTDSTGTVTTSSLTANTIAGNYAINANSSTLLPALFNLTNNPDSPFQIIPLSGTPQTTTVDTNFGNPLVAQVTDQFNNPIPNITVNFTTPNTGASATINGSTTLTTDSTGTVTTSSLTANTIAGNYAITANSTTLTPALFNLTNNPDAPFQIIPLSGTPQTTTVNTNFGNPLVAQVTDQFNNPIPNVAVNFTTPNTGASATINGSTTLTTDSTGTVTTSSLTANTIAGNYAINANSTTLTPALFNLTNNPDAPFQIIPLSGTPQTTTVDTNFGNPLVAQVTDRFNNPIPNIAVNFTTPNTGASATINGSTTLTTDSTGTVTTSSLTANTIAGNYAINANSTTLLPANFNLTNNPDAPFQIIPLTGTPQTTTVNTNFGNPLVAQVTDQFNNPIPDIAVNFTTPTTGASATINGSTTLTTDSTGTVTTSSLTANTIAGNYAISANYRTLLPANFNLTNNPDSPFQIIPLSGTPQTTTVNTNFGNTLVAQVTDQFNNPIPNVAVNFTTPTTGASATINGSTTLTTDSTGTVTTSSLTANTIAGNYAIKANSTPLLPATFNLTNNPDAPFQIIPLTGTPQTTIVNTNFGNPLVAQVTDQFNNPIPDVAVNFTTPNTGASATINGSTTLTTDSTGTVTTSSLTANTIAGNYAISANLSTLLPANFNLTNNPDAPFQIIPLTGTPQTTTVNTNFGNPLVAQVTDQFNNPIPNIAVNFTTPNTGASATINGSTTLTTDSTGTVTTSSLTANTIAGNYSINANSSTLLPANFNLTNNPDSPFQIIPLTGTPQTTTVNTNFGNPLVAQVTDQYGNPTPNIVVNVRTPLVGPSATISGANNLTTDNNGIVTTGVLRANTRAGNFSAQAQISGTITGTSGIATFDLTNTPDVPFQIIATDGTPQTTTVNTNFSDPLVATVTDRYDNPIPNVSVNFITPTTGASTTISGPTLLLTDSNGRVTTGTLTANTRSGNYQVRADSSTLIPANFNLNNNPDVPAQITITGTPQSTRINTTFPQPLTVQVSDQYGNPIPNLPVNFNPPNTGPSAIIAGSNITTTDSNGIATVSGINANLTPGTYSISATIPNLPSATFQLTNLPPNPSNPPLPRETENPRPTERSTTQEKTTEENREIARRDREVSTNITHTDQESEIEAISPPIVVQIPSLPIDPGVNIKEISLTQQFTDYLGINPPPEVSLDQAQETLVSIEQQTGLKPALFYISFIPTTIPDNLKVISNKPTDELELLIVTSKGQPIRRVVSGITREMIQKMANKFKSTVTNLRRKNAYLEPAQQLYKVLIEPIKTQLEERQINNLVFLVDQGLRGTPLAALHDGQKFLVEDYNIGFMPSLALTDTRYKPLKGREVLAMGASEFKSDNPLPAVPVEVEIITSDLWKGKSLLNDQFTFTNIKTARLQEAYSIIHLATHAEFQPGNRDNSYIQLWDKKLPIDQIRQFQWNDPPVELLVLSACRTALGDSDAELGFAGLAVRTGVKSALGSLWYVSDTGTLALMQDLYLQLKQQRTKVQALRETQLNLLKGTIRIENSKIVGLNSSVPLPPELANTPDIDFKHPYFWSSFTLVGSPW